MHTSASCFSPLLAHNPPLHSTLLPPLLIIRPPPSVTFLFTFPILPSVPRSLPPASLATLLHHLSCRHPRPAHIPALLISPTPPLPLLLSLSGRCVTVLLLSSCGPSPIIDHFDCDTDHFCCSPFLPLSHPEGERNHYVQQLQKKKNKKNSRRGMGRMVRGTAGIKGFGWTERGREG